MAAVADADRMRHTLALLAGAAEARAVAAELDAQLLALARGVDALTTARWRALPWQAGLWGCYFAGTSCSGAVQSEEVSLPRIDNRQVGGTVATNFSAEWDGEIDIPGAGDWTMGGGLRWTARASQSTASRCSMPPAWSIYTRSRATPAAATSVGGWHPIRVQYMQGEGGSAVLRLICGADGRRDQRHPDLRASLPAIRTSRFAALAAADPAAGARAADRLGIIVARLQALAARLSELDQLAASCSQDALAHASAGLGPGLSAALADGEGAPARLCASGAALVQPAQAVEAAARLAADKVLPAQCPPELAGLEQALARMQPTASTRSASCRQGLPQAKDRHLATARSFAALQGWREEFTREVASVRGRLLAEARASADPMAEREGAAASRSGARAARGGRAGGEPAQAESVATVEEVLHALGHQLAQAREHLEQERAFDIALAADAALARLSSAAHASAANRPLAAASELATMRDDLVRALPALPADDVRVATLREWSATSPVDSAAAPDAIRAICPEVSAEKSYTLDILASLDAAVERYASEGARGDAGADDAADAAHLAASEAAVGITGEALGGRPAALHRPGACLEIASDLDAFARGGRSADDFRELATRSRAARCWAGPTPIPPRTPRCRRISPSCARSPPRWRPPPPIRRAASRRATRSPPSPGSQLPRHGGLRRTCAAGLDDEVVDARMRFAVSERAIALDVPAAVAQLPSGAASEAAARALQAAAAAAQELSASSSTGTRAELARRARQQAARLRMDGVLPLARSLAEAATPAAATAYAAPGRQVATLAQQAADAAAMLDALARRLGNLRGQIAGGADQPLGSPPSAAVEGAIAGADAAHLAALASMAQARERWLALAHARAQGRDDPAALAARACVRERCT